ncbi:radical SAM domain protein [Candidatus Moduliflexus flocculans]|uniref:Radical SAM domain protein n=1 Tax=Candidatus Moduliflexus flocculans TaxID=1499966 RepID=A0A081BLZ2_9BACT|nr:radical SAM domain protein [Candidatus Moduliflexus flocculans]
MRHRRLAKARFDTSDMTHVMIVHLPSPPHLNVFRDWAGGYGTALPSERDYPGHDQRYFDVPNLQFLYIARQVNAAGYSLSYHDLQRHERFASNDFFATLRQNVPHLLLSSVNLPSLEHDLALLKAIKTQQPTQILLIGSIARMFHERILREEAADYIVMEHEELVAPAVIHALLSGERAPAGVYYHGANGIEGTPSPLHMTDLNFVDFPAYELLDFAQYESTYPFDKRMRYTTLFTSRGCPYPCQYCPYPVGFGKKVLYRSPELVVSDLRRLVNEFGVQFVVFRDQLLTLNRAHCEKIFQEMIREQLSLIWLCETRYDLVDHDLLRLMYQAGCREINYGLETADEETFATVGKAQAKQGLDYFGQIIQETKAAGIRCHTHLMLGLPNDSWPSIRRTIRFLRKHKPDSVQVAIFIPYPGTPLGEQLRQEGLVHNETFQDYTGFRAVIPTKHLSIDEINEARQYVYHVWNNTLLTRGINRVKKWFAL